MGNIMGAISDHIALRNAKPEDIDCVPFKNKIIRCKVVDVYDGNTCTVIFRVGGGFQKLKMRVMGIDTPEIKPNGKGISDKMKNLESNAAIKVKKDVEGLILNKVKKVKFIKWDKYGGRIDGHIYLSKNLTLSDYLIQKKYAKPYNGKAKKKWTNKELETILS